MKLAEGFTRLAHHGSELKKRRKRYPNPKNTSRAHYQNVIAQNKWIRGNIFYSMGNYLYCHDCVLKVDEKKLGPFVVMPSTSDLYFKVWWKDLPNDHQVSVRYPFDRHGLAGRLSNHAKVDTKRKFLDFVDSNSQPNE